MLGCFTVVNEKRGDRYPERPFMILMETPEDDEDCDDANEEIGLPQTYYLD